MFSLSINIAPTSQMTNDSVINSPKPGLVNVTHESLVKCNGSSSRQGLCENGDAITINGNQLANASVGKGDANSTQLLLGGYYYGKIKFSPEYPYKPPSIRFAPHKKICLSISDFHPERWNPIRLVSSILTGLLSFMELISDDGNKILTKGQWLWKVKRMDKRSLADG